MRLTAASLGESPVLHAADLHNEYGTAWCGLLAPAAVLRAETKSELLAQVSAASRLSNAEPTQQLTYSTVCPDCERIYRERYPDPATFNVHASDSDATVVAVLLSEHTAQAPGD